MNCQEIPLQPAASVNPRRHENTAIIRNGDRASIQSLMMDAAAGKPVTHRVRPPKLDPANMSGLQTQVGTIQLNAVATERATVIPDRDDCVAERTISLFGPRGSAQIQTNGPANTLL